MFITPAFAQAAGGGGEPSLIIQLLPFAAMIGIFYFLLIRPQQRKVKEHQAKVTGVRKGDKIVTGGGLIGKITKVIDDHELEVELTKGIKVRVVRNTISDVYSKTEPVSSDAK